MKLSAKKKSKFVKIVSRGKKKVRRKLKRTRRRMVRGIVWSVFLFGAGTCIGLYHDDIMRWVRKMKLDQKLSEIKNGIAGRH